MGLDRAGRGRYGAMTNLPGGLRQILAAELPFSTLDVETQREARDGTVKTLFRTHDGHPVEAVLMRYRDGRRSLCLSSQSGCPLTCTFCATGAMAFGRNLTASEILDQALHFRRIEQVDHAVFMGMGEPMLNLDTCSPRRVGSPTSGSRTAARHLDRRLAPRPHALVDEVEEPIRLALSLHAPTDELRSRIMPVNERYPLEDVLAECRRHFELRRRKIFVEYVMLAGVNDSREDARRLARLLDPQIFKVNLIPYNPTGDVRRLDADGDRRVQVRARRGPDSGDRTPHARPRHRGRMRATGRCAEIAARAVCRNRSRLRRA